MSSEESFYDDYKLRKNKQKGQKKTICKDKSQKGKKTEKGKPKGLAKIQIAKPDIWATNPIILEFLRLLLDMGRHINLHLAGTTHIVQSDQKQQKLDHIKQQQQMIKDQKPLYDFLEDFSKQYLKLCCATRCVVFFIRNNIESKPQYRNLYSIETYEWRSILKQMYFLLDEKFYEELQFILYHLERNVHPLDITNMLIEKAVNLSESPQILQNLFIQLFLEKMINFEDVKSYSKSDFESLYFNSIRFHKERIISFIQMIFNIFNQSTMKQYEPVNEIREIVSSSIKESTYENEDPLYYFDD